MTLGYARVSIALVLGVNGMLHRIQSTPFLKLNFFLTGRPKFFGTIEGSLQR